MKRKYLIWASLMTTIVLCSCMNAGKQVASFANPASSALKNAGQGYEDIKTASKVWRNSDIIYGEEKLNKLLLQDSLEKSKPLKQRIDDINSLKAYVDSLNTLATADFTSDINEASTKLHSSTTAMFEKYKITIDEDKVALVATMVNAVALGITESKRNAALKSLIITYNPAIKEVCGVISKNLNSIPGYNVASYDSSLANEISYYNEHRKEMTPQQRSESLENLVADLAKQNTIKPFFERTARAVLEIADSHNKLKEYFENNENEQDLVKSIMDLASSVEELRKFYDSLN